MKESIFVRPEPAVTSPLPQQVCTTGALLGPGWGSLTSGGVSKIRG